MKEASRKVVGDVAKVFNGLTKRFHICFLLLHLPHKSQVAFANRCPGMLLLIGQDLYCLMHQLVGALERLPQPGSCFPSFCPKMLPTFLTGGPAFFFCTPA